MPKHRQTHSWNPVSRNVFKKKKNNNGGTVIHFRARFQPHTQPKTELKHFYFEVCMLMPTYIKNKTHVLRGMKEKEKKEETIRFVLVLYCGFYYKGDWFTIRAARYWKKYANVYFWVLP